MGAKLPIFISCHFDFGENMKKHFPKGIFQWNLAHSRSDYKYIYITEIKIRNFYSCEFEGLKKVFPDPNMLIYAIARKRRARCDLFFPQKKRMRVTITKKYRLKTWPDRSDICEKRLWDPMEAPPSHSSVKKDRKKRKKKLFIFILFYFSTDSNPNTPYIKRVLREV